MAPAMKTEEHRRIGAVLVAAGLALAVKASAVGATGPTREPIVLHEPADLAAAVAAIEAATGAKGAPLETADGPVPPAEGRAFALDGETCARLLAGSHASFRKAGLYLFRTERSYGMAGDKDRAGILVASGRAAVIRRIGTAGPKQGVTPEAIVAFLDALEKDEPFDLVEVGVDYVAGRFHRVPLDPAAIAARMAEFAPELVAGRRDRMLALLAEEIRTNRTLYLFW